jgi:hypothetical protein
MMPNADGLVYVAFWKEKEKEKKRGERIMEGWMGWFSPLKGSHARDGCIFVSS